MSVSESQRYLDRAYLDLQAARSNLQQGFYGVAITRAYYAMFYAASALLASEGISRSKHSGVHSAFGERFVKGGLIEAEYAKMLGHAFDSRLDSDYDVEFVADQALAEDVLNDARRFVDRAERYLREAGKL
jgi:uncharacterized protein (UPF0332 family)